jgi:hypothetical protein
MQIGSSFATPTIVHHELYPAIGFDVTAHNQQSREQLQGSYAHDGTVAWISSKYYLQLFNLATFKRTHLLSFKDSRGELMVNTAIFSELFGPILTAARKSMPRQM